MPESIEDLVRTLPSPVQHWYAITNEATPDESPTRAKVRIYDAIGGWWGTNASEFVAALDALDVDEIDLHINSPGGAVWDGLAIMNSLKAHRARVTATVDGLAASAASIVAMGADEVVMAEGSQMMIHKSSGGSWGNADDMRDMSGILDKIDLNGAAIYARKAGGSPASWLDLMAAETWYNADEAVAAGLADRAEVVPEAVDAEQSFNLSIFNYAGRSHAPAPRRANPVGLRSQLTSAALVVGLSGDAHQAPGSSEPGSNTTRKENSMKEFLDGLRQRLGVTNAEASEADILAALDESLSKQFQPPEGTILVDAVQYAELQSQATEAVAMRVQQDSDRRDGLIDAALSDGRVAPVNRAVWRTRLDENEAGTAALLATLPTNSAIPVAELGYTGAEDESSEDVVYNKLFPKEA